MSLSIPLSSPDITEAEVDAVTAVLRTPHLSLGPELAAFESALADYHSIPHAIAVSSGTAGLHIALLTLGVAEGDEVVVPSFAFIAVANAVLLVGAQPVFADIDPLTLNLTPSTVESALTPRTRAILAVHTFGIPADMRGLRELADRHQLVIIEDACEALGAELQQRRVGTFGDLSVFGFYPNKQITTGEGGAVLAHTQAHADRLRSLRNQGRSPQRRVSVDELGGRHPNPHAPHASAPASDWLHHPDIGFNYRLSEMACALGRVQLSRLDDILTLRRSAAERYQALLSDIPGLELPPLTLPVCTISWFVYVVRLPQGTDRARIQDLLANLGIATSTYFAPIHQQPAWREYIAPASTFLPVTESMGPRTLAIPFFNRITAHQQQQVAAALREAISLQA
ncbi:DegT/DnrJ/EryC1/StrS family aminotransferase [Telmatobacter sp. DSM 110680]|uniref:DegT/DnrJ/EryC1/StrS family aminotransferase n=1 Tax=Telmatobacter sp. DSM 110680 TaxID=3036704 RepID=A0AAU7DMX5_9BACT